MEMESIRIGAGAGTSGDRIEPAAELAERGDIQYLVFECLAERTIALAQQAKLKDPASGYDPLLVERMEAVLGTCHRHGTKIITNMGAANPVAAAERVREVARSMGLSGLKIAAVTGDDVLDLVRAGDYSIAETGGRVASLSSSLISANAYLGVQPIIEALEAGAQIVITGRVADPALFLAPLVHEFKWSMEDWERLGRGIAVGHLLECAGQISGGYFADPGRKDVDGLARLGFPIAEVREDGVAIITKVSGSGGKVDARTCKEQLLYEIHDPSRYLQPDVVADFSRVSITELGPDRVLIDGGTGWPRTDTLKVSLGYRDGFVGEGQISYAGPGALERGRLALEIVAQRLKLTGVLCREMRYDLIGVDAIHGAKLSAVDHVPYEVRARVTGRADTLKDAVRVGNEVDALYTNGPAGGGGVTKSTREIVAMRSMLLPRQLVKPTVRYLES
jgi:hypothetical protein